jgi:hypothetical protein
MQKSKSSTYHLFLPNYWNFLIFTRTFVYYNRFSIPPGYTFVQAFVCENMTYSTHHEE